MVDSKVGIDKTNKKTFKGNFYEPSSKKIPLFCCLLLDLEKITSLD